MQTQWSIEPVNNLIQLFNANDLKNLSRYFSLNDMITKPDFPRHRFFSHAMRFCSHLIRQSCAHSSYQRLEKVAKINKLWDPAEPMVDSVQGVSLLEDNPITIGVVSWMIQVKRLRDARLTWAIAGVSRRGRLVRYMLDAFAAVTASGEMRRGDEDEEILGAAASIELSERLETLDGQCVEAEERHRMWQGIRGEMRSGQDMLVDVLYILNNRLRFLNKGVSTILAAVATIAADPDIQRHRDKRVNDLASHVVEAAFASEAEFCIDSLLRHAANILHLCHSSSQSTDVIPWNCYLNDEIRDQLILTALFLYYRAIHWLYRDDETILSDAEKSELVFEAVLDQSSILAEGWSQY